MLTGLIVNSHATTLHSVSSIPEKAHRINAVLEALKGSTLTNQIDMIPANSALDGDILRTHSLSYLQNFRASSVGGMSTISYTPSADPLDMRNVAMLGLENAPSPQQAHTLLEIARERARHDTPITPTTFQLAALSAGSVITAIDAIRNGAPKRMFCLTRPPGHHAQFEMASGFCFFNNVAIGARYLLECCSAERVAILDFDVHHGDGTQNLFYADPNVLTISIHRDTSDFYPYRSGTTREVGTGAGLGYNLNIPLPRGSSIVEYRAALAGATNRLAEFAPSWLLVSAGFDAHRSDSMGGMALRSKDYGEIATCLKEVADSCCQGRLVSVLEGGYHLGALGASVREYLTALSS